MLAKFSKCASISAPVEITSLQTHFLVNDYAGKENIFCGRGREIQQELQTPSGNLDQGNLHQVFK